MTTSPPPRRPKRSRANLHNLSLTTKEDWNRYVNAPRRTQPDTLSPKELDALSERAAREYNRRRLDWHANLGPFKTPQYQTLQSDLWNIVDSNLQDGHKVKGAIAVDSPAGVGKTTTLQHFAKEVHLQQIADEGERTDSGHERWPVCWVSLTGQPTMREVNRSMLSFFAHPGSDRGTATQYVRRALDCVLNCEVRLLVIDDLHFLRWPSANGMEVSNHFKFIANTFPVTLVFIGVGLVRSGLLDEGRRLANDDVLAQTRRRTTVLGLDDFNLATREGRLAWRQLLLSVERRIVLANAGRGMVADVLRDYLYGRSGGHIGSLMTLINRGCAMAIRTGTEALTGELLDNVKLDAAAEEKRAETEAALRSGALTTRP
ncbi:ATPase AAA [Mycobacterium avium subsp. hominissuis 10-5606]|nr:ATPase AAA [Mycobacterium avium subsp. hominissuis 10-5606]